MKMTTKNVFTMILAILAILMVVFLGSAIKITNPWIWIGNLAILAVAFIGGYVLGVYTKK